MLSKELIGNPLKIKDFGTIFFAKHGRKFWSLQTDRLNQWILDHKKFFVFGPDNGS
jgi:hypothetical protein